ncbi:MAG: lamin tail domain-containing protein [Leptospirales bacterium]|nr:lamin tail domain-containing protein [Leptospirales bacterium]
MKTGIKRIGFLAFLVLFSSANCKHSDPDDLLGMLLAGRMVMSFPMWSHAGAGNQGAVFENTLVSTIGLSRTSVQCAFQDVNLGNVTNALFDAKARGVKVRVGVDEDNRSQPGYRRLSEFLITGQEDNELYAGNAGSGQVYTNVCVGDATRVFISTAPPTVQGFYSEPAFGWYFQDSETGLPRKFQSEMDLITHGSFGSSKAVLNRQNYYLLSDMEVGVYMAPKEGGFENFAVQRIKGATNSIRIFSTEFFSNDLDGSDVRRAKDLAYETRFASVVSKQVIVSSYASLASDPDASGGLNSANYLSNNGLPFRTLPGGWPDSGLNFIVVDGETPHPQLYVASFPFSARADSAHDGFLLVFEYAPMIQAFADFYDQLQGRAMLTVNTTGDNIVNPNQMEVVISELNWMGSYNTSSSASTSEYVELYNNTNATINISGWLVQCGTGGTFGTTVATLPQKSLIGPGQFFVLAQSGSSIVAQSHSAALSGSGLINDTTTEQCRLTDGAANGNTVLDVIGVNGTAFSSNSTAFGLNNTTSFIRRSMERITLNASGSNTTNWHTNSNSSILLNLNFVADKIERTYGTPGYYNSPNVPQPPPPTANGLVINEIIYNDGGVANNDAVELYNTTSTAMDLAAIGVTLQRDSTCDLSNGVTSTLPLTGTVPAGGYFVIAVTAGAFNPGNLNGLASFATGDCLILASSSAAVTAPNAANVLDFVALGRTSNAGFRENSSYAIGGSQGSVSRCSNGSDTNVNNTDFLYRGSTGYTLGATNSCGNDPRGLKINEVAWNCNTSTTACGPAATAAGDMVEIYNPTASPVNLALAGVYLRRDSSCALAGGITDAAHGLTGTIPAGGYYTLGGTGGIFAGAQDQALLNTSLTTSNCIFIAQGLENSTAITDLNVIDFVGWGTSTDIEGTVAPGGTTTPNYIKRCSNGTDTNVNGTDFTTGGGNVSQGAANNCP